MQEKNKGLLAIHISVLLFGIAGIFGQVLDVHPIVIVMGRVFFATISLLILLLFLNLRIALKQRKDYFILAFLGALLAFHWVAFFQAIQLSTVAIGLLTFATFPVFTVFLEPLFFKEKLRLFNIVLAFISFVGILIILPDYDFKNQYTQAAIWGISSGLSFSILSILNRKYVQNYSPYVMAFYQDFWAMVVLLPFVIFLQPILQTHDIFMLMFLGLIFTALAHTLFIKSLASISVQKASVIASLEPVYGIVFAIFLIDEIPSFTVISGAVLILGAAFIATVNSKHNKS